MKSTMGYASIKTAQNPHISQAILFANTIKTPKCVSMIPNTLEYFYCCLIMTHPWHTYKVQYSFSTMRSRKLTETCHRSYPPKINRKNYCTVQYCRKPLGPKMTHHNVLPELGSLFPRFALSFSTFWSKKNNVHVCARVKSSKFVCYSDRVRLCAWRRWRVCAM